MNQCHGLGTRGASSCGRLREANPCVWLALPFAPIAGTAEAEAARLADSVAKDVLRSFDAELQAAAARQRELEGLTGEAVRTLKARQAEADGATATINGMTSKLSVRPVRTQHHRP